MIFVNADMSRGVRVLPCGIIARSAHPRVFQFFPVRTGNFAIVLAIAAIGRTAISVTCGLNCNLTPQRQLS
ncbi:MAG: hypothetical protein ACREC1_02420 [Methylovirgula sp.]